MSVEGEVMDMLPVIGRHEALELAIRLMEGRSFEFPGHDPLLVDYEQIAIGCAQRLLEWIETGRYRHE